MKLNCAAYIDINSECVPGSVLCVQIIVQIVLCSFHLALSVCMCVCVQRVATALTAVRQTSVCFMELMGVVLWLFLSVAQNHTNPLHTCKLLKIHLFDDLNDCELSSGVLTSLPTYTTSDDRHFLWKVDETGRTTNWRADFVLHEFERMLLTKSRPAKVDETGGKLMLNTNTRKFVNSRC